MGRASFFELGINKLLANTNIVEVKEHVSYWKILK